ncbi:hypothetical protein ACIQ9R_36060 [Streptomyces sp. NPDC094447]|uniref:hypothetical protein n=1 Tax=Streptomyces sp. NPDC094447 TaxID=3366062 RepID=UPI0037F76698
MTSTLPATDYDKVRAKAAADVREALQQIDDPKARRATADEMREAAYLNLAIVRPERDQLIAAYAFHHPYDCTPRELCAAFGLSHSNLRQIRIGALGQTWGVAGTKLPSKEDMPGVADSLGLHCTEETGAQAVELAVQFQENDAAWKEALHQIGLATAELAARRLTVPPLERPDFATIRDDARDQVLAEFADITRPDERLERSAEVVIEAQEEMDRLIVERDQLIASLSCYTTAKAVYFSAGLSRTGLKRVMERALRLDRDAKLPTRDDLMQAGQDAGVPFVENAHETLPKIAREYERHRTIREAATQIRDAVIPVLVAPPYQWTHQRIADAAGIPQPYVTVLANA